MSETPAKKIDFNPYQVWGTLMVLTIVYGVVLTLAGGNGFMTIFEGLWYIKTNPATLTHDYIAMVGVGPALINSALSGLLMLAAFKFAKLPGSGPQMGVFGLVMGFALLGKNPFNMFPILLGGYLFSLYKKEPYKNHVTMAGFATALGPIVSQIPHLTMGGGDPMRVVIGPYAAVLVAIIVGAGVGFVINSMAVFIRKSHEGLNLYNIGWGAGLFAIGITVIYTALGVDRFGPGGWGIPTTTVGYQLVAGGQQITDAYGNISQLSEMGNYDHLLYGYLAGIAVFFLIVGILAGGKLNNSKEILTMNAGDSKFINNFYAKYGKGHVYLAMSFLTLLAIALGLVFGVVHLNGPVLGAMLSMIGWAGFGKSMVAVVPIISGVILGALARYLVAPQFLRAGMNVFEYFSTQGVIWTSAFWGTCLAPMARFFGWKWALPVGMLHFAFAFTIAPFHWGQNLYNNGLAAGFVCVCMIPIIRAIDKKGKYAPEKVYPDPQ